MPPLLGEVWRGLLKYKTMKVLITGVAGFIGSNLAIRLLDRGHTVIGIDNLAYGFMRNIESIRPHPNFTFLLGDIANPHILNEVKVDIIVHLASQKIPRYSNALRSEERRVGKGYSIRWR